MERELAVTAAFYLQFRNDVQSSSAKHLILFVRQSNRRSNNNAVAGMNTNRVHILHRTNGDDVAFAVTNDLKLNLLPTGNTFFNQDLSDRRKAQTVF